MQKKCFLIILFFYLVCSHSMETFADEAVHGGFDQSSQDTSYTESYEVIQQRVNMRNEALQSKYQRREELLAELMQQKEAGLLNFDNDEIDFSIKYQQKVYEEEYLQALEDQKSLQKLKDQENLEGFEM